MVCDLKTAVAIPVAECAEELKRVLAWSPGEHREIRVLADEAPPMHAIVSSAEDAAESIRGVPYGHGAYVTINVVKDTAQVVKSTGKELVRALRGNAVCDRDIARRSRFVVDVDPQRPRGTSATPEQLAAARDLASKVISELRGRGWPIPAQVMSGNGIHMYWGIDLDRCSTLPELVLKLLAEQFSNGVVKIDTTVSNASRIMRIPGTWTAKDGQAHLHRVARLEQVGDSRLLTEIQMSAFVASAAGRSPTKSVAVSGPADHHVQRWLKDHGVRHRGEEPWPGGGDGALRWVLERCPFDPKHDRGEAVVTIGSNQLPGFRCHHDSCSHYQWKDFKLVIETASRVRASLVGAKVRPEYPVECLPVPLRDAVKVRAEIMEADSAAVAVSLLAASMGVIGNAAVVKVQEAWTEPIAAWMMLVAPSGGMKTPILGFVETLLANLEDSLMPAASDDPRPRVFTTDATAEAMADLLSKNPRGMCLVRDELSAHLNSFGQYKSGKGGDRGFWLSTVDGKRHAGDRKTKGGSVFAPRALVSKIGGIQPGVLRKIVRSHGFQEDGFAARFWYVNLPPRVRLFPEPSSAAIAESQRTSLVLKLLLENLRAIPMQADKPIEVPMDAAAVERFREFVREQETRIHLLPDDAVERSCIAKSRGWVARMAGLIALVERFVVDGQRQGNGIPPVDYGAARIDRDIVERAIKLVEWQLSENGRTFAEIQVDPPDRRLARFEQLALEAIDPVNLTVSKRNLQRHHNLRGVEEAAEILESLVKSRGWIKQFPTPNLRGGAPTCLYSPPGLHAVS